jgi:uncharacterized protein
MLRSLEQILIGGVIIAGAVYLLYGAWLYVNQQRLLYYPDFALRRDDLPTEEFAIDGETIRVHALNTEMPRAVLYFGGNAEAVGYQAEALTRALPARALYLVNYRGYGGSTGQPREQALYKDAVFIFDALEERHDTIAVIGRSLGSGVATWLAARRPVERLVLATPFDSLEGVARAHFPFYPVSLFLKERYDSIERAAAIDTPTLLLIAADDEIVPRSSSRRLEQAFADGTVTSLVIPHARHNSISARHEYDKALAAFLGAGLTAGP